MNNIDSLREAVAYLRATKLSRGLTAREYKIYAFLTPIFMIGEALLECLLPFYMSEFVDEIEAVSQDTFSNLVPYIIILIVMATLSLTFGVLGGRTAAIASTGLAKNLRGDLYRKLQSFSFENIDKFSNSSLVTRMTTDVTNTQQAFQMCIRIVVRAPLMLIFSIVMAFIKGGNMAWIFICIIPIVSIGLLLIMKLAMPVFRKVFKKYDDLNESVQENVSGIRVVKSYVREKFEEEKFNTASNNMTKDFIKAEKILAFNNPIMNFAIHLSNILVCSIGSLLIYHTATVKNDEIIYTDLSVGQLSALLTYGVQILMSLMMISMIIVMLAMSIESIRRIAEVLEEDSTIKNPENPIFEIKDGSVSFKNVGFKYSSKAEKDTLSNINLEIKSGQFVGIIGSTGAGKTSLVNLISRLYDVSEQGGTNVSGGQKQRLCIARAILKKPKILILDDSTSAVDTKTDKLIRTGLRNDIPDTTKIVIAQRISSIEDADQIIVLDEGKIDAIGTNEELLKNNKIYQEVYYTQNKQGGEE